MKGTVSPARLYRSDKTGNKKAQLESAYSTEVMRATIGESSSMTSSTAEELIGKEINPINRRSNSRSDSSVIVQADAVVVSSATSVSVEDLSAIFETSILSDDDDSTDGRPVADCGTVVGRLRSKANEGLVNGYHVIADSLEAKRSAGSFSKGISWEALRDIGSAQILGGSAIGAKGASTPQRSSGARVGGTFSMTKPTGDRFSSAQSSGHRVSWDTDVNGDGRESESFRNRGGSMGQSSSVREDWGSASQDWESARHAQARKELGGERGGARVEAGESCLVETVNSRADGGKSTEYHTTNQKVPFEFRDSVDSGLGSSGRGRSRSDDWDKPQLQLSVEVDRNRNLDEDEFDSPLSHGQSASTRSIRKSGVIQVYSRWDDEDDIRSPRSRVSNQSKPAHHLDTDSLDQVTLDLTLTLTLTLTTRLLCLWT